MESLKQELLQTIQTRDGLMKWKLLIVSVIGAAALGLSGQAKFSSELALCLIPFACCYTDHLCRNQSIRALLLSRFMAVAEKLDSDEAISKFEGFYQQFDEKREKNGMDALEGLALVHSTRVLSFSIIPLGVFASIVNVNEDMTTIISHSILYTVAAIAGYGLSLFLENQYKLQKNLIPETIDELKERYQF